MARSDRALDLPRGFTDTTPERATLYETLRQQWFAICALSGYQSVHVPPVGFTDTFTTGHHAAGAKLYRFADRRGRDLTLVSDSLPALLRAACARGLSEQRLSFCCPIFRYERRPRRHFHHLGLMETLDRPSALATQLRSTTRLARTLIDFLSPRLHTHFTVADPGIWRDLAPMVQPQADISEFLKHFRRIPPEQRPAYLHDRGAPPALITFAEALITDSGLLDEPKLSGLPSVVRKRISTAHELAAMVRESGAPATVDFAELHASEFHDGPSFQLRPRHQRRLLGDGGSYGQFASGFLKRPGTLHSAVIGLERLADLVSTTPGTSAADIALLAHDQRATIARADQLATTLRAQEIRVWDLVLARPLWQHLRDLAALEIPYSVIIGKRELDTHAYVIRGRNGELHQLSKDELASWLLRDRPRSRRNKEGYADDQTAIQ